MRKALFLLVVCVLAWVPSAAADPRPYLDLDFELPECSTFWPTQGFTSYPYEHRVDATQAQSGRQSLRVDHLSPLPVNPAAGPYLFKILDAAEVAGKRVRFSGHIRTEGMTSGYAGLFLYATGPQGFVLQDLAEPATGTTPWTRYELEADVPPGVTYAFVALERTGVGTVWFDNLGIEVDGHPLKQGPPSSLDGPPPGHANWLRERVVPLDALTAGNGFADLQALAPAIGDARIVALGEGTHGTREFFQMKHRLFEYLVEEKGFTHLAFEGGMPEWRKINEYVLTGMGDPAQLLEAQGIWPWNTREVLDLIVWMRQYNAAGKGPVQIAGFDMPFAFNAAIDVANFLFQADREYYLTEALPVVVRFLQTSQFTAADVAAARGLYDHMVARRQDYLAAGFIAEQVDWRIQEARNLVQLSETRAPGGGPAARDRFMAENVGWLLDHAPAGSKIALWAHNGHVKKSGIAMGLHLVQRYGNEMYVIGFTLKEGTFNSQNVTRVIRPFEAVPAPPSSVEGLLVATGIPNFFVDLRGLGDQGPAGWFHETKLMRSLGTPVVRCGFFESTPGVEYDGLIHIDRSTPSVRPPFH